MKVNVKNLLLSLAAIVFLGACDKNSNDFPNDGKNTIIKINNNSADLMKRVSFEGAGVINLNKGNTTSKTTNSASDFPLVQIGEIHAPLDAFGRKLQANHVYVQDKYAYVAYTYQGEEYSGALDVIDVSDPYSPKIINSALIKNTDITSLTYADGKLLLAAAADLDQFPDLTSPSIVIEMQLNNGLLTDNYTIVPLQGQVTTAIVQNGNAFFSVTGDKGKLFKNILGTNLEMGNVSLDDLRAVLLHNDEVITLSGTNGVQIFKENNLALARSFSTPQDVHGAKRTMDIYQQKLLVAEGFNGVGVYTIATGQKVQTLPINGITDDSMDANEIVTNAVSVNDNKTFVANGAAGISVYQNNTTFDWLGKIAINGSSNYVKSKGDYIYVASGKGGLKILKIEGKPETVNCGQYPIYTGNASITLNSNEQKSYSGSTALSSIIVNSGARLIHCGALAVEQNIQLNSDATMEVFGTLAQGQFNKNSHLTINSNAELKVSGSVVIYGDLKLNSGAKLTFVGSGSSITIFGTVTKGDNVKITGNFTVNDNKLNALF